MPTGIERSMSSDGRSGMSMRKAEKGGESSEAPALQTTGARGEVYIKDRKHIEEAENIKD